MSWYSVLSVIEQELQDLEQFVDSGLGVICVDFFSKLLAKDFSHLLFLLLAEELLAHEPQHKGLPVFFVLAIALTQGLHLGQQLLHLRLGAEGAHHKVRVLDVQQLVQGVGFLEGGDLPLRVGVWGFEEGGQQFFLLALHNSIRAITILKFSKYSQVFISIAPPGQNFSHVSYLYRPNEFNIIMLGFPDASSGSHNHSHKLLLVTPARRRSLLRSSLSGQPVHPHKAMLIRNRESHLCKIRQQISQVFEEECMQSARNPLVSSQGAMQTTNSRAVHRSNKNKHGTHNRTRMRSIFDSQNPPSLGLCQQISVLHSNLITSPKRMTLRYRNLSERTPAPQQFLPALPPTKTRAKFNVYRSQDYNLEPWKDGSDEVHLQEGL